MTPQRRPSNRPPPWRDVRVLRWVFQLALLVAVIAVVGILVSNVRNNSERLGIPTGFEYLDNPAQFPIPDSDFRQTQPVREAVAVGLLNTLRVSLIGIVLASVLGTTIGVARLSGNWLIRSAARVYVETIRNIPLLLIIVFSYTGLALSTFPRIESAWEPLGIAVISNRGVFLPWYEGRLLPVLVGAVLAIVATWAIGRRRERVTSRTGEPERTWLFATPVVVVLLVAAWFAGGLHIEVPELAGRVVDGGLRLSPEFFAILFALVIYTSSHIAEIVRGSIQAVQRGQGEAALALGLSGFQRLRYVVLPQAFRIALPALGNQYLNLMKNSTLGAVVSYFELAQVTSISVGNGAPAVPSYVLTLALFLGLSLVLSAAVNVVNRRLALVTR